MVISSIDGEYLLKDLLIYLSITSFKAKQILDSITNLYSAFSLPCFIFTKSIFFTKYPIKKCVAFV